MAAKAVQMAKFRTHLGVLMKRQGVGRMDLVRDANLSYPTVKIWETDELARIDADTVQALMSYFKLKRLDELVYTVEDKETA